ncbi:hypothetical protein [Pseudomonas citronellolis]|uniref:hypothetical protein n=1 Tax=Pseudomonas citronellolis TaxID=53408 RepID=UPI0020A1AFF3|nr:hypothetical protein [Pseudomonas citronellolis]MCP1602145.1 hypothetical protein [Pseudomonas citronellolis]MCP1653132.1 hypothetical protein [Pseudomonas citronellolis]MCP1720077.1 hypothetical protein [Pseudomonas citronellolis]
MSDVKKGFCLAATQPDIPPPVPAPERRYALRSYQLNLRQRSLPLLTELSPLRPLRGD